MKDRTIYRILEIIPGTLVWTTFLFSIIISFWKPIWVIFFIIVFDIFWVYRVLYFVFYMVIAWFRLRNTLKQDWFSKVKNIPGWDKIYHAVFLPTYNEDLEILTQTLDSLIQNEYPKDKMIIILGFEERVGKDIYQPKIEYIQKHYSDKFFKLLITVHPGNLPGELAAKGANANWMGHRFQEWVDQQKIPYENIIVSYFDCDTQAHYKYFSVLTYTYLTHPNPYRTSYQPVALYNNNIWDSPIVMRLSAFSTVFWLLTELMRPERLYTFSSHSMSFKALVEVGFWQKDIVTDDSRIFLQCFIHYNGDYTVTPMFIPVSMDTVLAKTLKDSYIALYKQIRRWAWSVEHFPYMIWNFFFVKNTIPLSKKLKYLFNLTEGIYSWATVPILIFILGHLPLWVIDKFYDNEKTTFLVQYAPLLLEKLMITSMLGLVVAAVVSFLLLPKRPKHHSFFRTIMMILQWLILPLTFVLGSIPAIDAQTRLMLGKYLGFFVSPKSRKQPK